MTVNYYVGWTGRPWKTDLMPEPTAPSNYKDPAKIAAAVQEKRAKQLETAGGVPIYGKLEAVTVVNDLGGVAFTHTTGHPTLDGVDDVPVGLAFADFLLNTFTFPTEDTDYELRVGDQTARLIGLEVKTPLKMAAMEVFVTPSAWTRLRIPTRMWYRRTFCVDPFEMLRAGVPDLTLDAALSFLGSEERDEFSSLTTGAQADANAWAARDLATLTGIAPALPTATSAQIEELHSFG